jgi:hypothetical protein
MAAALNRLDSNGLLYPAGIACGRAHTFSPRKAGGVEDMCGLIGVVSV